MTQPVRHEDKLTFASASNAATALDSDRQNGATDNATRELEQLDQAIREAVGEQNFQHWFHKRTRFEISGNQLIVHVPNPFILNWLLRRFRTALNKAAQLILGPSASSQLEVDESLMLEAAQSAVSHGPVKNAAASAAALNSEAPRAATEVSLNQNATSARGRKFSGNSVHADRPESLILSGNRRRFRSFESFVGGECNDLSILAARQVSATPGERYNPLFIHGGTGTGKTHLLEAIYSEIRRIHPLKNVMYLTSEAFTNYFTSALSSRTVPSFRQRFRNVDVLLIDNIEFLDNKRATQEEFLHTIVQLIDHGGQVVISSDRHPRMLTKHREELTTRFLSGLVCRIEAPDDETRRRF